MEANSATGGALGLAIGILGGQRGRQVCGRASGTWGQLALGLGGAGQVLGRLGYQTLVRRVGVVPRTVIVMAGVAATTALLGLFTAYAALVAVAIGAGVMRGIMTLLQATAVTERWGPTHYYGHLSGILTAPIMIATAVGPFVGAALASLLGGYAAMFPALGAIAAAGALIALATGPRVHTVTPSIRV